MNLKNQQALMIVNLICFFAFSWFFTGFMIGLFATIIDYNKGGLKKYTMTEKIYYFNDLSIVVILGYYSVYSLLKEVETKK